VIKMKRLGLALMIASLALLVAGQAMATLYGSTSFTFTAPNIYELTIENTGDPTDTDAESIQSFTATVQGTASYTAISAGQDWQAIFIPGLGMAFYRSDPTVAGSMIDPGEDPLGGFIFSISPNPADPTDPAAPWVNLTGDTGGGVAGHSNPVPEPATLLLIGVGLIAIAGYAAQKRTRA
jgi:hypothetical protein